VRNRKGMFKDLLEKMRRQGYTRMRIDGELRDLGDDIELRKTYKHDIDLVVDRLKVKPGIEERLDDSVRAAFDAADGECLVEYEEERAGGERRIRSLSFTMEQKHTLAFRDVSPQAFSFNSPLGMCDHCQGLGTTREMD